MILVGPFQLAIFCDSVIVPVMYWLALIFRNKPISWKYTDLWTRLSGAVEIPEGQDTTQRDQSKLEKWAHVNLFNKDKCKILHMGRGNPWYQYSLVDEGIESSPSEKVLGVLVNGNLDRSRQCAFTAQKASRILGCIKRSVTSRSREVIPPLYSALLTPHLQSCLQLWSPQHRKEVDLLEQIQRKATKMIRWF